MEYQKITNLSEKTFNNVPKCITKIWIDVYNQSQGSYNVNKLIRF